MVVKLQTNREFQKRVMKIPVFLLLHLYHSIKDLKNYFYVLCFFGQINCIVHIFGGFGCFVILCGGEGVVYFWDQSIKVLKIWGQNISS